MLQIRDHYREVIRRSKTGWYLGKYVLVTIKVVLVMASGDKTPVVSKAHL